MFIRNDWYIAAWAREVPARKLLARTICNDTIVLFRDASGKAAALEDRCSHRGAPLSCGEMVAEGLQCGYHGLVFGGNGLCVSIPGQPNIPPKAHIKSYPLVEQDEFLWIWTGDPAKADPAKIVAYPWNNDHGNWPHRPEHYHVECNFMLLVDNLMDLTHLGHVDAKMDVTRTDNGVKCKSVSYVDIRADSARVHARRVLERRLAEEAGKTIELEPA